MKYLLTVLVILFAVNCSAQNYLLKSNQDCFELGVVGGAKGSSIELGFQTIDYKNLICGFGAFGILMSDYKTFRKPNGVEISEKDILPTFNKTEIVSKGNFGWGIGGRLIFKYGFAIEAGYLNYKYKQSQIYQSTITGTEYNTELNSINKEGYFLKTLFLPEKMKLSFGISYSSIEKLGLYFGYRF